MANTDPNACSVGGCGKSPGVHVSRASARRIVEQANFCDDHIRDYLVNFRALKSGGVGTEQSSRHASTFDIELVIYDGRSDQKSAFWLREVGGQRRLECVTGPFEAWALHVELQGDPAPRPLTHRAMASVVAALGGRVDCVKIDNYQCDRRMYEAKLSIQQGDRHVVVDVRISDALILAVVTRAPIIVSDDVIALSTAERGSLPAL